jgi:hypothetical protein
MSHTVIIPKEVYFAREVNTEHTTGWVIWAGVPLIHNGRKP